MENVALHTGIMRMACRLWVMVLLLFCQPALGVGGAVDDGAQSEVRKGDCIVQHDGLHRYMVQQKQMPLAGAVITAKNGERVGGSRPLRLIPTHGGKPGRTIGRWAADDSFHLSHIRTLLRANGCGLQVRAASPRYYYVIALRRLLC